MGTYHEDPVTNPEDPTAGTVYLTLPEGDDTFEGAMSFTYLGCQEVSYGTISGTKTDIALSGEWIGSVDGRPQSGSYEGTYDHDLGAYGGTYTVSSGKQHINVQDCVSYWIAPHGTWRLFPVGSTFGPGGDGVSMDGTRLSWASPAGTLFTLVSVIDMAAALEHGRAVGGPALRELTFHQRAALLKALASHLREHREELYELSAKTGATLGDSKFDIDGGIGVLFSYSSKGRRELPNDTIVLDGAPEPLGKAGTLVGQHLYTSRPGVAVQINPFNFPVWGMLEKLAPAFLAGLPTIVKPASQTAYLTEAVVRRIVDSGILPDGALQLLCGSAGTLLFELDEQDHVAFTGSAHTAGVLRNHPAVLHRGVRLGVEADSLNCSILGPDVTTDDPEFDLFVKQVAAEMTVKAGQKCTAIRRILVPEPMAEAVTDALVGRLSRTVVGAADREDVRMGPLVSLAQREEVRKAVRALTTSCDIVYGDPENVETVGADAEAGAFMSPVLLRARPGAADSEADGPGGSAHPWRIEERPGGAVQPVRVEAGEPVLAEAGQEVVHPQGERHHLIDFDAAEFRDAPQVIALKVQEHHVLGDLLGVGFASRDSVEQLGELGLLGEDVGAGGSSELETKLRQRQLLFFRRDDFPGSLDLGPQRRLLHRGDDHVGGERQQGAFQLEALEIDLRARRRFRGGEGDEAGELVPADLRPGLPELRLEVGEGAVEARDGLDHREAHRQGPCLSGRGRGSLRHAVDAGLWTAFEAQPR